MGISQQIYCKRNHKLEKGNLYFSFSGKRRCRKCKLKWESENGWPRQQRKLKKKLAKRKKFVLN